MFGRSAGIFLCLGRSQCRRNMTTGIQAPSRLSGKVAIVTASTDGIGYAIARRLAQEGARVMVSSRKADNVKEAINSLNAENLNVKGLVCHVGNAENRTQLINETLREFGQLDILVSNAAANPHMGSILDSTDSHWDKLLDINVKSAFLLAKEAIPHLEKTSGSIVFITSIAAYVPFEAIAPYSTCKTALLGLVKSLMPACASKQIRVNAIAPGIIKTNFSKALWSSPAAEKAISKQVPLRRLGTSEDVAGAAAFLVSSDASYITGETIVVAGGMTSRL